MKMSNRIYAGVLTILITAAIYGARHLSASKTEEGKPNILFAFTDDQSWIHAGAYGTSGVKTPAFDRVAREGVLFSHAFTAAPSCTPSRSAVLTGQNIWRVGHAGLLHGGLPKSLDVFPLMLRDAGYFIGHTGKSWGPGRWNSDGRTEHPVGKAYDTVSYQPRLEGLSPLNYAANFELFLKDRPSGTPFFFWYGSSEPHRVYRKGQGLEAGKKLSDARLFSSMLDNAETRSDVLDYYVEIEHFDRHLGRMIRMLEEAGELDNTLIIVTSDHGMPFPRGKSTLYDSGTRVPLAVRWPKRIPAKRWVDDFTSLTDVAPTILEAAGIQGPEAMTGRSLMPILTSEKSGQIEPDRDFAVIGFERHTWCREEGAGYPARALRTKKYLYIRNYHPERWPAGNPEPVLETGWSYGDVDRGPSYYFVLEHQKEPEVAPFYRWAFGKRPGDELYDVEKDPDQIRNLAADPAHAGLKKKLAARLTEYLKATGDPRMRGEEPWNDYLYYSRGVWKQQMAK